MRSHRPKERCVAVLMATYNGEKYLDEQLSSLEFQQNVCVHLFIWDDNSTDGLLAVLDRHQKIDVPYLGTGERMFASKAFLELLTNSHLTEFSYIAFCDQDDIWKPTKLWEAIEFLEENPNFIIYCTKREILKKKYKKKEKYPKNSFELSYESLVFENKCYGNTMVFRSTLRQKFLAIKTNDFEVPHDWLLGRLGLAIADVHFDARYQILYRIHSDNDIGKRKFSSLWRLRLTRINKSHAYFLQEYQTLLKRLEGKNSNGEMTLDLLSTLQSNSRSSDVLKFANLRLNPYENLFFKLALWFSHVPNVVPTNSRDLKKS